MTRTTTTTTTHRPEDMQCAVYEVKNGLWTRVLYQGTYLECVDWGKNLCKILPSKVIVILPL